MTATPTVDQLKRDIDSARADLIRIESQQDTAQKEMAKLEEEVRELGLDAANLYGEANRIAEDVHTAVTGIQEEIATLTGETAG